jgi:hypothetical protein
MILLSLLFTLNTILANELSLEQANVCLAIRSDITGYSSFVEHEVVCDNGETFYVGRKITSILFPIPYKWGEASRNKMYREMNKLDFKSTQELTFNFIGERIPQYDTDLVHVFENKTNSQDTYDYCIISKRYELVEIELDIFHKKYFAEIQCQNAENTTTDKHHSILSLDNSLKDLDLEFIGSYSLLNRHKGNYKYEYLLYRYLNN